MWDFLDKFDKNLLYYYADTLANGRPLSISFCRDKCESELEAIRQAENRRNQIYYLIWFVFRYVLKCKTLDEALQIADENLFRKFGFVTMADGTGKCNLSENLYIGADKEIKLYKPEDIPTILEILYNRYDFFEQIECFKRNASKKRGNKSDKIKTKYLNVCNKG